MEMRTSAALPDSQECSFRLAERVLIGFIGGQAGILVDNPVDMFMDILVDIFVNSYAKPYRLPVYLRLSDFQKTRFFFSINHSFFVPLSYCFLFFFWYYSTADYSIAVMVVFVSFSVLLFSFIFSSFCKSFLPE